MKLSDLHEHIRMLQVEERLLLEECDWDALAQVRMALDATYDQIATINKGE